MAVSSVVLPNPAPATTMARRSVIWGEAAKINQTTLIIESRTQVLTTGTSAESIDLHFVEGGPNEQIVNASR
jgi:hypothetical protein